MNESDVWYSDYCSIVVFVFRFRSHDVALEWQKLLAIMHRAESNRLGVVVHVVMSC